MGGASDHLVIYASASSATAAAAAAVAAPAEAPNAFASAAAAAAADAATADVNGGGAISASPPIRAAALVGSESIAAAHGLTSSPFYQGSGATTPRPLD
eukprot:XP_001690466.1 predicted protein [Chlamydomonas reinhardtii]